jgi:hypothetical protein
VHERAGQLHWFPPNAECALLKKQVKKARLMSRASWRPSRSGCGFAHCAAAAGQLAPVCRVRVHPRALSDFLHRHLSRARRPPQDNGFLEQQHSDTKVLTTAVNKLNIREKVPRQWPRE